MSTRKAPTFLGILLLFSLCLSFSSGAAFAAPTFHPMPDCTFLDTRQLPGPAGGPAVAAGTPRIISFTGICGIPPTAVAVAVEVAAFHNTSPGSPFDLRFTVPAPVPAFSPRTRMNCPGAVCTHFAVPVVDGGQMKIVHIPGTGSVHVILTASGYFE